MRNTIGYSMAHEFENTEGWVTISDLTKKIFRTRNPKLQQVIKSNINNVRGLLETKGLLLIPNWKEGQKRIDEYKIAKPEDTDYITRELIKRNGRHLSSTKKLLKAVEIVREDGLLKKENMNHLPTRVKDRLLIGEIQ